MTNFTRRYGQHPTGILSAILLLTQAPAAAAQEQLVAGRPDFTESPQVADAGVVILEAGSSILFDGSFRTYSGPELQIRVGVGQRWELRLGVPDYNYMYGDGRSERTIGEGSLQAKWNLDGSGAFTIGIMPEVGTPIERTGNGGGTILPRISLFAERALGDFTLGGQSSVSARGDSDIEPWFSQTLVVSRPVGQTSEAFVEFQMEAGSAVTRTRYLLHIGIAHRLSDDLQIDLHGGRSLRRDALPFLGAGLVVRL